MALFSPEACSRGLKICDEGEADARGTKNYFLPRKREIAFKHPHFHFYTKFLGRNLINPIQGFRHLNYEKNFFRSAGVNEVFYVRRAEKCHDARSELRGVKAHIMPQEVKKHLSLRTKSLRGVRRVTTIREAKKENLINACRLALLILNSTTFIIKKKKSY